MKTTIPFSIFFLTIGVSCKKLKPLKDDIKFSQSIYSAKLFSLSNIFVAFALLLNFLSASASPQPAYYVLGEEEFKGVQIYDVIQDNDWNYWFSTNEGLIYYDHYTYQKIECGESKSISFFNFVINQTGTIFCNNLNNQIFKLEKNRCTLFYEVAPNEVHADIKLIITPENNLLIGCQNILLLNASGILIERFIIHTSFLGIPYRTKFDEILFPLSNSDSVIVFAKEKFKTKIISYDYIERSTDRLLYFFGINENTYAIDLKTKSLFSFNEKDFALKSMSPIEFVKPTQSIRIYTTEDNAWLAGTLPGVTLFDAQFSERPTQLFYSNFFISDVYQDKEGNILLSTFDHGVFVISDLVIPDVIRDFKDDPIAVIKTDLQYGMLFGTSKGKLINYQNEKFEIIHNTGEKPIEVILTSPNFPWLIFDDGLIRAKHKKTKKVVNIVEASLKDGAIINESQFYISTNIGLAKITLTDKETFLVDWIDALKFRNYAVEYNVKNNLVYASTINGLFIVDSAGIIKELLYGNESIFTTTLHSYEEFVYAPLSKSGILIIEGSDVKDKIEPTVQDKSVSIFKMTIYDNAIFALTDIGLCQFDLSGKLIKSFNQSSSQSNQRVLDFVIIDDVLWISNPNGLQTIDLNYVGQPIPVPQIKISHVFVNDNEISLDTTIEFASNFRKFEFVLSSPTLKYKSEISYHYQLKGYDENWIVNDYFSNKILYNALAPGDYEFLVRAEHQTKFSPTVNYKFSIAYPFYLTWWFITLLILIFLVIVIFIYRRQLNSQRIKARQINELNASKLTAIQSQMNPHFIFNSLNSIQDLILKGDVEHSYSYITTFSNLVRRTLSYSDKDFIDFEKELKLLELYLSLEKLRFKKDFSFSLVTNDITDIQIPPMLIQPFIENALVHGLLHKEGEKKLTITFTINHHLICVVEDNGIGREQAKAIKLRQRTEHESFSVQAIRKRFEILSEHFKGELGYTYTDLTENGKAIGTRVTIQIPIKHKF